MTDDMTSSDEVLAQEYAREAIERSPSETWQWLRGNPSDGWRANIEGTRVALIHGERRANVEQEHLRALFARTYAAHFAHETFWLFMLDPLACLASSGDRALAEGLEARWHAFDVDVRARTLDDSVESVRRAALLAETRMAGLFDETLFDARVAYLDECRFPTLTSIAKAGRTLAAYLTSPERQRYIRDAKPSTIRDASLSLDLIRWTEPPPGVPLFAWLSVCEDALTNMPLKGTRGTVYVGQGGATLAVSWRCEDGARNVAYDASLRT